MKLQGENTGKTFSDINCTNGFFGQSPKAIEIKTKINKWDLIKLNKLLHCKGNHKQNKKTTTECEKISVDDATHKSLIPKYTDSLYNSITKQTQQPSWKMAEDLSRHFSKEEIQMANRHMKRCSTSLVMREMQIKTTMRYNLKSIRMAIMKTSTSNKCWRRCGGKRALVPCWWECKLVQLLQKTGWRSLKTKQNKFPCDPIPLLPHTRREWSHRKTRAPYVHTALLTTARHGDPFKPTDRRVDKEDVVQIYTTEYRSATKNSEIRPFATTWMQLEITIFHFISLSVK